MHFLINSLHESDILCVISTQAFEWPEDLISVATPHVKTEWSKLHIPPRQYKYCSPYLQELTEGYEKNTAKYYEDMKQLTNVAIAERLSRRVNEQGKHPSLLGTKDELIARLFESDYVNFVNLYHPPRDVAASAFIERVWENDLPTGISSPVLLHMQDLVTLKPGGTRMSSSAFLACINLLNRNDDLISKGYNQIYEFAKHPSTRTSSFIVHPNAAIQHMSNEQGDLVGMGLTITSLPFLLIVPMRLDNCLLVAKFSEQRFMFYSVKNGETSLRCQEKAEK